MQSPDWAIVIAIFVAVYCILILLLLRFGLVATITTVFFVNGFEKVTLGADWTAWYAPAGIASFSCCWASRYGPSGDRWADAS